MVVEVITNSLRGENSRNVTESGTAPAAELTTSPDGRSASNVTPPRKEVVMEVMAEVMVVISRGSAGGLLRGGRVIGSVSPVVRITLPVIPIVSNVQSPRAGSSVPVISFFLVR